MAGGLAAVGGRSLQCEVMARPEGLEPPTYGFEGRRSIQLSYRRAGCGANRNLRGIVPCGET